ncbi:MAG: hypothetical protein PVS3B1_09180 [Ktedonobacteraceae bacterium]
MLKFINNMQISHRLLLAFLLAAVIPSIVISLLGFTFIREQDTRSRAVQINIGASKATGTVNLSLLKMNILLNTAYQRQYESNQNLTSIQVQEDLDQLQSSINDFDIAIQHFQQNYKLKTVPRMRDVYSLLTSSSGAPALPDQQQAALNQVDTLWSTYRDELVQIEAVLAKKAPGEQLRPLLLKANNDYTQLVLTWDRVSSITEDISAQAAQVGPLQTNPFVLAIFVGFLGMILVITVVGYIVYRTITRPLRQLAHLSRRIAMGEIHMRPSVTGNDEIYLVATSMNAMLDSIVSLLQEAQAQRDALKYKIEKLLSEVSGIGEGDLRVQAEVTTDALGVLGDSFNYMVDELGGLIVRVKSVAGEVDDSTKFILKRMLQLVETGNKQIEQVGTAKAEVDRMSASSRQVAERAKNLYEVTRQARQDAYTGREATEHTIAGMSRISENVQLTALKVHTLGERSREINDIVDAIASIAHHTNRMALDAAVQAVSVGEHGMGFAALAADIRRLAERAKDQAGMISHMLREVRQDIGEVAISMHDTERETMTGVQLIRETGMALEAVFAVVEQQGREIENVNQVARQQLKSAATVVQIMKEVTESTRHNGQSTQEASRYMQRLGQLVDQLRISVAAFRLRDNLSYYNARTTPAQEPEPVADGPMTVSGVFRTMNVDFRAVKSSSGWYTPPSSSFTPPPGYDPFAFTPMPGAPLPRPAKRDEKSGPGVKPGQVPRSEEHWSPNK